jgi:surfactin synthase thioesterase subunit
MTAALRIYRANVATILLQKQPKPGAPTLGLWAEGDRFLVESQMTRSEHWVDGPWRYERFPGDHWTPIVAASRLNEALLSHLGRVPAASH